MGQEVETSKRRTRIRIGKGRDKRRLRGREQGKMRMKGGRREGREGRMRKVGKKEEKR